MLYIGERVGKKGSELKIDIALDPLEGTTICARGGVGSISVIAVAENGNFLHAPDTYMDKIACGPRARGTISLEKSPEENIKRVAEVLNKPIRDLTVVVLDRPRHEKLIASIRKMGARIRLIDDGDVSAGIATSWEETGIDLLMGIGGAPEGVITAAALKCMGGDFQGRLKFRNDDERLRAERMGCKNIDQVFTMEDLARGSVGHVLCHRRDRRASPFAACGCSLDGGRKRTPL